MHVAAQFIFPVYSLGSQLGDCVTEGGGYFYLN